MKPLLRETLIRFRAGYARLPLGETLIKYIQGYAWLRLQDTYGGYEGYYRDSIIPDFTFSMSYIDCQRLISVAIVEHRQALQTMGTTCFYILHHTIKGILILSFLL